MVQIAMELKTIGIIHTSFQQAQGTPIQSAFADGAEGVVEVFDAYAAGLKDLEGFERIWLVYWFDRTAGCKLEVTPYMDTQSHGVFATRAPTRPNPIGLSPVKLEKIEGSKLYISDADMLDGTPLLDIKPYTPKFDHFEVLRSGWMDAVKNGTMKADERFHK
jgi:tRNA-Thr(GGU) m(6)t(6)A37 methyltransferase TsaA